jgi:GTP-binding protein LepA
MAKLKKAIELSFLPTKKEYNAEEIGVLRLKQEPRSSVKVGDVGYIISGIKGSARGKSRRYHYTCGSAMRSCNSRF